MRVKSVDPQLEAMCSQQKAAVRELGLAEAKGLAKRIKELEAATSSDELLAGTGGWHRLSYDFSGCLSGKVSKGCRVVVEPINGGAGGFEVLAIGPDVYKH